MTTFLQIATVIATCLAVYFQMRKFWWAPIYGLLHEGLWAWMFIATCNWWMLIAVAVYAGVYASAIRGWARERWA